MIIYPAIDLKDGKCVRLYRGDMCFATVFNEDPVKQAEEFASYGFEYLHVVDLDGAVAGRSVNFGIVSEIVKKNIIKVQLGGGIRSMQDIDNWFEIGVWQVILGTVAVNNPDLVFQACEKYPNRIILSIDAKKSQVLTNGWTEQSQHSVIEIAKKFSECKLSSIIYTDTWRDGTLSGFDQSGTLSLAKAVKIPVIVSGGIANVNDLLVIKNLENEGIVGAIVGRAWYEKKITSDNLKEAKLL